MLRQSRGVTTIRFRIGRSHKNTYTEGGKIAHVIGEKNSWADIIYVIVCLKGGVGKSTLSASLAYYLSHIRKKKVGLWDMDITSPSIPKILNIQGREIDFTPSGNLAPIKYSNDLSIMSVDFFLPSSDQPIIFDEKMKKGHMIQFLKSVEFGQCDYFVFDTPPTTSPEFLTILKLFPRDMLRIILTTQPGGASSNSVKKSIQHIKATGVPITGIVTSMDGHTCPQCGHYDKIFPAPVSIKDIATKYNIPYLGRIELGWVSTLRNGSSVIDMKKFTPIGDRIVSQKPVRFKPLKKKLNLWQKMRIAQSLDSGLNKNRM